MIKLTECYDIKVDEDKHESIIKLVDYVKETRFNLIGLEDDLLLKSPVGVRTVLNDLINKVNNIVSYICEIFNRDRIEFE